MVHAGEPVDDDRPHVRPDLPARVEVLSANTNQWLTLQQPHIRVVLVPERLAIESVENSVVLSVQVVLGRLDRLLQSALHVRRIDQQLEALFLQ